MSDNPKIRRRLRCPNCGALDTLKWGVRNGVQRYRCRNCQSLFSARRNEISKSNRFIWFKKWVLGKIAVVFNNGQKIVLIYGRHLQKHTWRVISKRSCGPLQRAGVHWRSSPSLFWNSGSVGTRMCSNRHPRSWFTSKLMDFLIPSVRV